jgi:hypothetical protein
VTYELATGRVATLPQPRPITGSCREEATYDAIGDRWARVIFSGYHYAYPAYVDRPTSMRHRSRARSAARSQSSTTASWWAENHFDSPGRQTGRLVVRAAAGGSSGARTAAAQRAMPICCDQSSADVDRTSEQTGEPATRGPGRRPRSAHGHMTVARAAGDA